MQPFKLGDIVMADVPEPGGKRIDHEHPVIVSVPKSRADGKVLIVVISHKLEFPRPVGHFDMPWAIGGHDVTGLWMKCVAKCDWYEWIEWSDIEHQIGVTPPPIMDRIRAELSARLAAKKAAIARANLPDLGPS